MGARSFPVWRSTIYEYYMAMAKKMGKGVKKSKLSLERMRKTGSAVAIGSTLYQAVASPPIKTLYNYHFVSSRIVTNWA
jgi:hypothetical protein